MSDQKDYQLKITKDGKEELAMLCDSFEEAQAQAKAWNDKPLEWALSHHHGATATDDTGAVYTITRLYLGV